MAEWLLPGAFWGFLIVYGAAMYVVSPRATAPASFYGGTDAEGRSVNAIPLTLSIFISWIFAKSVTNAANLGAAYGAVGAFAYAIYWLSIPVAGLAIYYIRRRFGATSLVGFLTSRYGPAAALAFTAAVLVRLYNETWSNTAVVGGYYDRDSWIERFERWWPSGSPAHRAYFERLTAGPAFDLEQALGPDAEAV